MNQVTGQLSLFKLLSYNVNQSTLDSLETPIRHMSIIDSYFFLIVNVVAVYSVDNESISMFSNCLIGVYPNPQVLELHLDCRSQYLCLVALLPCKPYSALSPMSRCLVAV
jgi:hypothetical protein